MKAWREENEPLGKELGYPKCCISDFCSQPPELLKRTGPTAIDTMRYEAGCIDGKFTGFIPCYVHAKKIVKGEIALVDLIEGRSEDFPPFPKFGRNDTDS